MSEDESTFPQGFYRAIEHREPIEWNHPWRVDLCADEQIAPIDPVAQLRQGIVWSALESVHLFSGFRGTGKTTELRRLTHELRERGIKVVVSDVREYLNLAQPFDIGEFLLAIAGALGDAMADPDLLGTHLMLCYRNGVEWYDVHPLVVAEVEAMVARLDAERP